MSPSTSIVIPVHGRAALTKSCLEAVLGELAAHCEVVVVDDASADETPAILASFGERIRSLRLEENGGFARACNEGARLAAGEQLVFLNNDTQPRQGWLEALRDHARLNPGAAVVGAKLLYPTGTVQHAGVVFGQDGYPHHLYAGFPGDHPAVCHPRRLQAVTAACMLVARRAFERVGGFDEGYLNSLEDVDLCLRIGEDGGEVHYCPGAEVVHLESASRGRRDRFERSVALYRERWRNGVRRDDLEAYVADGLLAVEYAESHPVRLTVDPLLAIVDRGREEGIERLLEIYARQSADLLREVVRLSAATVGFAAEAAPAPAAPGEIDREEFLARVRRIEGEIRALQEAAASASGVEPGDRLGYGQLVEAVRRAVEQHVPAGSSLLVVSRGDRELVRFGDRHARHFPADGDGGYAGYHPADSAAAIAELEQRREEGSEYLVLPPSALWWREYYQGFAAHIDSYERLSTSPCMIFRLGGNPPRRGASTLRR